MTVDPELQKRAEEWCEDWGLSHEAIDALTLAFQRERLMGQKELLGNMERQKRETLKRGGTIKTAIDWLSEVNAQLASRGDVSAAQSNARGEGEE